MTDEWVDVPTNDAGDWSDVPESDWADVPAEEPSWLDTIKSAGHEAAASTFDTLGYLGGMGADAIEKSPVNYLYNSITGEDVPYEDTVRLYSKALRKIGQVGEGRRAEKYQFEPGSWKEAVSGSGRMAPTVALGAVTMNPYVMALPSAIDAYGRAREEGLDVPQAAAAGIGEEALGALLNRLPISGAAKGNLLARMAKAAGGMELGSLLQTPVSMSMESWLRGGETPTSDEVKDAIKGSLKQNLIAGAAMGAGGYTGSKVGGKLAAYKNRTPPEATADRIELESKEPLPELPTRDEALGLPEPIPEGIPDVITRPFEGKIAPELPQPQIALMLEAPGPIKQGEGFAGEPFTTNMEESSTRTTHFLENGKLWQPFKHTKGQEFRPGDVPPVPNENMQGPLKPGVEEAPATIDTTKTADTFAVAPKKQIAEAAKPVQLVENAPVNEPSKPITGDIRSELKNIPHEKVDLSLINLSKDVPNFKRKGLIPLKGDFEGLGTGPIVLWRRLNGVLEVITGRHRYDLAKRRGEKDIWVQIVDEAKGFTKEMAHVLDAEANIRDGKGEVADFALYHRGRGITEGEAEARGLFNTNKGRQGFSIATRGGEEVYTAHQRDILSDNQAAVIADAAPGDTYAQSRGLAAAKAGKNLFEVEHITKAAALIRAGEVPDFSNAEQLDMFKNAGFKELEKSQQIEDEIGTIAAERLKELAKDRAALGSRKAPERAAKGGLFESTEQALERADIADVEAQRIGKEIYKLQNWDSQPEVVARYREEAIGRLQGRENEAASRSDASESKPVIDLTKQESKEIPDSVESKVESSKAQTSLGFAEPGKQSTLTERIKDQKGTIAAGKTLNKIAEKIDNTYMDARTFFDGIFTKKSIDQINKEFIGQDVTTKSFPAGENWMLGRYKGEPIPGSKVAEVWRKVMTFPSTLAEKVPNFRPSWEKIKQYEKNIHSTVSSLADIAAPYLAKPDVTALNNAAFAARASRQPIIDLDFFLKHGANAEDFAAYKRLRQSFDASLDYLRQGWLDAGYDPGKVEKAIKSLSEENFVPFSRFGDLVLYAEKAGAQPTYSLFESKGERAKVARELAKRGYKITLKELPKVTPGQFDGMSLNIIQKLASVDPEARAKLEEALSIPGWKQHLLDAKLVPGYSQDLRRATAEYFTGLARYVESTKLRRFIGNEALVLREKGEHQAAKYAEDLTHYVTGNNSELTGFRRFLTGMYLGGSIKSALVNLSQTITTTWPKLGTITGSEGRAAAVLLKGYAGAGQYLTANKKWLKKNPQLAKALDMAIADGTLGAQQYRMLMDISHGGTGEPGLLDTLMKPFQSAEVFNRVSSFIAHWEATAKKGMSLAERFKSAEDFIDTTQFDYAKANTPTIMRGKAAPVFVFRRFSGHYLRYLRNASGAERAKSLGAIMTLGGAAAFPLGGLIMHGLEAMGYDPKKEIRKEMGNGFIGDSIIYGPFAAATGANISGSLAMSDLDPLAEANAGAAALRMLTGVALQPFQSLKKGYWLATERGAPYRAVESNLPEFLRSLSVAGRGLNGPWTSAGRNAPLVENPSLYEVFLKSIGLNPLRLAKAYEKTHSYDLATARAKGPSGLNYRAALLLKDGDKAGARELILEEAKKGNMVNPSEIIKQLYGMFPQTAEIERIKKMPKKGRAEGIDVYKTYNQQD